LSEFRTSAPGSVAYGLADGDADAAPDGEADSDADAEADADAEGDSENGGSDDSGISVGSGMKRDGMLSADRTRTATKMAMTSRIQARAIRSSRVGKAPR
jgi:hypothetical protein